MSEHELCFVCDAETGHAGKAEDSLYVGDVGPFCLSCWNILEGHFVKEYRAGLGDATFPHYGPWSRTVKGQLIEVRDSSGLHILTLTDSVNATGRSWFVAQAPAMAAEIRQLRREFNLVIYDGAWEANDFREEIRQLREELGETRMYRDELEAERDSLRQENAKILEACYPCGECEMCRQPLPKKDAARDCEKCGRDGCVRCIKGGLCAGCSEKEIAALKKSHAELLAIVRDLRERA